MNETLQLALIGAAITLGLFPLFLLWLRPKPADDGETEREPLLGSFTEPLASQMPITQSGRDDVQKLLMGAGYYHPTALTEYRAIRVALTIVPLFLGGAAALLVEPDRMPMVLGITGVSAILGFSLPRLYLAIKRRARGQELARGLPMAIDLLNLCLTAGQNMLASLKQVATEMKSSHPVVSQELAITARQAELHSVETAMQQWADRAQVPEVSNLASLVTQSERLGTDTAATLGELATNFRTTSRQRAEAQANRTSFWMLFPSVFCFWVAAAIILIGPAYLQFFQYRQREGEQLQNQTRQNLERANERELATDPDNPRPIVPRIVPAPVRQ